MTQFIKMNSKVIIVALFLTAILVISNTYLALKVGMLTAASIPAAIFSMGIMRFIGKSNLHDHNLVQTAASSGEAVAGGVGYTVPALVIMGATHGFNYIDTVLISLVGGVMGVLFSAVIRRALLSDEHLKFPEGQAIAEVLKLHESKKLGFKSLLQGGLIAAIIEFFQSTQVMISSGMQFFKITGGIAGVGFGLSPALIGAGYIVGIRVGISLFLGACLSYLIILPVISHSFIGTSLSSVFNEQFAMPMRYTGVGAMLMAAFITLVSLAKPIYQQFLKTIYYVKQQHIVAEGDHDLSTRTIMIGLLLSLGILGAFFFHLLTLSIVQLPFYMSLLFVVIILVFILVLSFVVAVICGYFSGLVGVSASPGSSILIGVLILTALLIQALFHLITHSLTSHVSLIAETLTIIIVSVLMQVACIANDTMQDLKVGQMVGTSPRKQQIMLIFGVTIASLIIPIVMNILYHAQGIAGAMPHPGMNPTESLAAPPAAIMAALTGAFFNSNVPFSYLLIGAGSILALALLQHLVLKRLGLTISYIGVGVGMYLSLSNSIPLIIGAILSYIVATRAKEAMTHQRKMVMACGMVAGASLMDLMLAIPTAMSSNGAGLVFTVPHVLQISLTILGLFVVAKKYMEK